MGDNLVGDVLHKSFAAFHTDHLMSVIHANENSGTLGIGKAANPFQIFVIPRLLVFDVLTFVLMHFII